MTLRYESCPACGDYDDGECPMCEGEGYVEEIADADGLAEFDTDDDDRARGEGR